jgi:hypothetical protein
VKEGGESSYGGAGGKELVGVLILTYIFCTQETREWERNVNIETSSTSSLSSCLFASTTTNNTKSLSLSILMCVVVIVVRGCGGH